MKVDAGASYLYASQRPQPSSADASASTSFSAALTAAQADGAQTDNGTKQANFTSMTRQEMRDWVNTQIRNGEMSLDSLVIIPNPYIPTIYRIHMSLQTSKFSRSSIDKFFLHHYGK